MSNPSWKPRGDWVCYDCGLHVDLPAEHSPQDCINNLVSRLKQDDERQHKMKIFLGIEIGFNILFSLVIFVMTIWR